ncbi:MAG: YegP family protein, partial [Acutalibacteraceae bacterium]
IEDRTLSKWKAVPYPKFEIYKDISGEFFFRLKSSSGEVIATSESYTTKGACIKGIKSIGKNAPECEILIR